MSKRLLIAALLAAPMISAPLAAVAIPPSEWCAFVDRWHPFVYGTGVDTREEIGYDCVLVFSVDHTETATLQASNEIQRFRLVLTHDHHPWIEDDQDVVVRNQDGCCIEVDANGYLLTIERTGVFGGDRYFTVFVDGRKVLICPWTPEGGPELDECKLDPGPTADLLNA
jgi:hypothetical protein